MSITNSDPIRSMDEDLICKSISLEERVSIRRSAHSCWPRGFCASLAAIHRWHPSYAHASSTVRGLRVVLASRPNRLRLVVLGVATCQLSRVGSTRCAMELVPAGPPTPVSLTPSPRSPRLQAPVPPPVFSNLHDAPAVRHPSCPSSAACQPPPLWPQGLAFLATPPK